MHNHILHRLNAWAEDCALLEARLVVAAWRLFKRVAGSQTELGTAYSQVLSAGNDYVVKLEIRDATKKVYIDGVERISDSDNPITAAGKVGLYGFVPATNSTGMHWADFSAADPAGGGGLLIVERTVLDYSFD